MLPGLVHYREIETFVSIDPCQYRYSISIIGLFYVECAKILLAQPNIEVNVQNKLGDTALHNAAWKGHVEIVEILLEKGYEVALSFT